LAAGRVAILEELDRGVIDGRTAAERLRELQQRRAT